MCGGPYTVVWVCMQPLNPIAYDRVTLNTTFGRGGGYVYWVLVASCTVLCITPTEVFELERHLIKSMALTDWNTIKCIM